MPYLSVVNVKSHRVALARLRVSSHLLHVETGRWARPVTPPENRYCIICPQKIEDEYHIIMECSLYNNIRQRLIQRYFWKRPSMYKLIELFNTNREKKIRSLAKFVYLAFQIRKEYIAGIAINR
jgi:hypothetical protein